jgi:hypothetical protein
MQKCGKDTSGIIMKNWEGNSGQMRAGFCDFYCTCAHFSEDATPLAPPPAQSPSHGHMATKTKLGDAGRRCAVSDRAMSDQPAGQLPGTILARKMPAIGARLSLWRNLNPAAEEMARSGGGSS